MKSLEALALAAVVLLGGWYEWRRRFPPAAAAAASDPWSVAARGGAVPAPVPSAVKEIPGLRAGADVRVYGPSAELGTRMALEALRVRGFDRVALVTIDGYDQFKSLGLEGRLRTAGLVDADGNVDLPFAAVGGELYSKDDFVAALSRLPLTNVRDKSEPYVYVYGPANCPYTEQGADRLRTRGIPYEFRDVNDPRWRPRFEVLVRAYGFTEFLWPVLEINGRMFSDPPIEVVQENFR